MPFNAGTRQAFLSDLRDQGIFFEPKLWENFMGGVVQPNAIIVEVDNEEQVQQVIRAVKRQNDTPKTSKNDKITIRATAGWRDGGSHYFDCLHFWKKEQTLKYNESFSFSDGAIADVIIRFSPKFQHVAIIDELRNMPPSSDGDMNHKISQLPVTVVKVTAGVQIATLTESLKKMGLALRTVSMIPWVSAVGLAGTGGHGTGAAESTFSGQITSMTICDMFGEIRDIKDDDPLFADLCRAHMGMLGIVLSINIKTVQAFNLRETVENFASLDVLAPQLQTFLDNNDYFTLMRTPTYPCEWINVDTIEKWQLRLWNHTDEARTPHLKPAFAADPSSLIQDLSVSAGNSILGYLTQHKVLQDLIPDFMVLTAAIVTDTRGTAPHVGYEGDITHSQASFPKDMHDVSWIVRVKKRDAGEILSKIQRKIDELLLSASKRGEFPITYAIYTRYLKGINGGLSSMSTANEDERILAIDIVTHPDAPGLRRFETEFHAFLTDELGIKPRFHLGKNFPEGIANYSDFLDPQPLEAFGRGIVDWHHGPENLKQSPFFTPFMQQMLPSALSHDSAIGAEAAAPRPIPAAHRPIRVSNPAACLDFLPNLIDAIGSLTLPSESKAHVIRQVFTSKCREKIAALHPQAHPMMRGLAPLGST